MALPYFRCLAYTFYAHAFSEDFLGRGFSLGGRHRMTEALDSRAQFGKSVGSTYNLCVSA
jgi:hypothetical protein